MTRRIRRQTGIESPCIDICVIDRETRLCIGCARTGDEIAAWSRLTPEARRAIMDDLPGREAGPRSVPGPPSLR